MIENFEKLLARDKPVIIKLLSKKKYACVSYTVYNSGIKELFFSIQSGNIWVEAYATPTNEVCGFNTEYLNGKLNLPSLPLKNEEDWNNFLKQLNDI